MGFLKALLGKIVSGAPVHMEPAVGAKPPIVDETNGNVIIGSDDYPKEQVTGTQFTKPGLSVDVEHVSGIDHDRAQYFRSIANPPTDTSDRTWGMQGSAETKAGNAKNFNSGFLGDLTGYEGAVIHWGSGNLQSMAGCIANGSNRGGGTVHEAFGYLALQPINADPHGGVIENSYGVYVRYENEGYADPLHKYGMVIEDACGPCGLGYTDPGAKLAVNGGISAGSKNDPGAGMLSAEVGLRTKELSGPPAAVPGYGMYGSGNNGQPYFVSSIGIFPLGHIRAILDNCGSVNINSGTGAKFVIPFGSGSVDTAFAYDVVRHAIKIHEEGIYLLSHSLSFEIDALPLVACSVAACWQWTMTPDIPGSWADLVETAAFDTVHSDTDDHGSVQLPPRELQLAADTYLRLVAWETGTFSVDCYINSKAASGGPFNWSWSRIEQTRIAP